MTDLTEHQRKIADDIISRFRKGSRGEVLAGLAGTGKTTVAKWLYEHLTNCGQKLLAMAPTGKAGMVLSSKGIPATTIHKAIYHYRGKKETVTGQELIFVDNQKYLECDLVIVDEASMVTSRQKDDIEKKGVPALWVGDPGQLPPIKSQNPGLFKPGCHILREIHRQAQDSPIIGWAHKLRRGANLAEPFPGIQHIDVCKKGVTAVVEQMFLLGVDRMIVKTNSQRAKLNHAVRSYLGRSCPFEVGERIICLRNSRKLQTVNGQIFEILEIKGSNAKELTQRLRLKCLDTGAIYEHDVSEIQLGLEKNLDWEEIPGEYMIADYASAMTCHKMQGSSAPHIGIIAPGYCGDTQKWNYTAATRAEEKVTVFC